MEFFLFLITIVLVLAFHENIFKAIEKLRTWVPIAFIFASGLLLLGGLLLIIGAGVEKSLAMGITGLFIMAVSVGSYFLCLKWANYEQKRNELKLEDLEKQAIALGIDLTKI